MTTSDPLRVALWALAAVLLGQGLVLAAAPQTAYDTFAGFGEYNAHGLRDMAAFPLAAAVLVAASVRRPSWRAPVLLLVGLQHALHAVNHLADVGRADPAWAGPADVVALAALAALCAWVLRRGTGSGTPA